MLHFLLLTSYVFMMLKQLRTVILMSSSFLNIYEYNIILHFFQGNISNFFVYHKKVLSKYLQFVQKHKFVYLKSLLSETLLLKFICNCSEPHKNIKNYIVNLFTNVIFNVFMRVQHPKASEKSCFSSD